MRGRMRLSVSELSAESRCWAVDPGRKPGPRLQEPDPGPGPGPDFALGQWVSSGDFSVSDDLEMRFPALRVEARSVEVRAHTALVGHAHTALVGRAHTALVGRAHTALVGQLTQRLWVVLTQPLWVSSHSLGGSAL